MARTTKAQWAALLSGLEETGNVTRACHEAGIAKTGAYARRNRDAAFRRAWDAALERGMDGLMDDALDRARHGWTVPVYHQGKECGRIHRYSDTLTIFMLKKLWPERFGDKREAPHSGEPTVRELLEAVDGMSRAGPASSQ